jgi:hypothetical protein
MKNKLKKAKEAKKSKNNTEAKYQEEELDRYTPYSKSKSAQNYKKIGQDYTQPKYSEIHKMKAQSAVSTNNKYYKRSAGDNSQTKNCNEDH